LSGGHCRPASSDRANPTAAEETETDPRHKANPTVDVPRDLWEHVVREHYYGEGEPAPEDVDMHLMEHVFLYPEWRVVGADSD
jgi:hypothetical protein